ncbi:MAG: helix-turn-helix domain-containing protein, partial [Nitrospirota bacterium]|nr:helix-turn-helix domain-containing protein [Nitrospirota bacterium]
EKDKSGFFRIKKLTHKELAARIGASREAISKVIKVLAFKDVVREEGDCLLISSDAESGM